MDFKKLLKKRTRTLQRRNMDMMFEAYLTHESGHLEPDDIPHTKEPVWILGKKYSALHGKIRHLASIFIDKLIRKADTSFFIFVPRIEGIFLNCFFELLKLWFL